MHEDSARRLSLFRQSLVSRMACNRPPGVQVNTEAPTYQTPTGVNFRPQLATGSAQQGAGNPGKTGLGSKSKARHHPQSTVSSRDVLFWCLHCMQGYLCFMFFFFPGVCFQLFCSKACHSFYQPASYNLAVH